MSAGFGTITNSMGMRSWAKRPDHSTELGLEPRRGSMAPAGESDQDGVEALARRIVRCRREYLPLLHDMYRKQYQLNKHKAPRVFPRVIEGRAGHVAPANGQAAR